MDDDVDVDKLADMTDGFVGADIESVCRRASMEAIRSSVEDGANDEVKVLRPTSARELRPRNRSGEGVAFDHRSTEGGHAGR